MPPIGHDEILNSLTQLSKDVKRLRNAGWGDVFSSEIDLRNSGDYNLDQIVIGADYSEKLLGVGCSVMEDVSGVPYVDLRVVGQVGNQTTIYDNAPAFNWPIWPFISRGDGSKRGDAFFIPMDITASRAIQIQLQITDAASSGKLRFVTLFGFGA